MKHEYRADFEAFYEAYPHHVGKLAAQKAYVKARTLATQADILAGVERYKATKPAWAEWCHPSTWLNAGRWMDQPAEPAVQAGKQTTRLATALANIKAEGQ